MTSLSDLGNRIAAGGTAELFAWAPGKVVKLYWDGASKDAAEREAERTRVAFAAGAPAPEVFDVVVIEDRPGIVFERIDGPSMLELIAQQPEQADDLAVQLADLQTALHRLPGKGLPPLREHVLRRLHLGNLPARIKPDVFDAIHQLPEEGALCHGDLHPGNVIVTGPGPRLIDWYDAASGTPAADLARTCVLLQYARLNTAAQTAAFAPHRQRFLEVFLDRYREVMPQPANALSHWFVPVAAARTAEPILGQERTTLLRVLETMLGAA